jgi:hypothetical protein
MTHIVPYAIDIGFYEVKSVTILSFSDISIILGWLEMGIISNRTSVKRIEIIVPN